MSARARAAGFIGGATAEASGGGGQAAARVTGGKGEGARVCGRSSTALVASLIDAAAGGVRQRGVRGGRHGGHGAPVPVRHSEGEREGADRGGPLSDI